MKRLLILLLTGLFAQFMVSCYPEGADKIQDYDVAMTNYDKSADFGTFTTFSIADTIVYFSNDQGTTLSHQFDQAIVDLVTENFENRGYVLVDTTENPSFVVTISAFSNVNYAYYMDNWYNNWSWYWGWWGGPFSPYYPWYPVSVYSYRTGSVVIDMISTTVRSDGKANVVWTGIADGLLQGSDSFIRSRLDKQINQCFIQSPYLSNATAQQ
ncbi:MAG: DUF4136 domain-containing protein [Odoribacter sp.]|nr:DUF4136 domain-containing protein [Odoribacter sp.]